jgi:hypothetical protein
VRKEFLTAILVLIAGFLGTVGILLKPGEVDKVKVTQQQLQEIASLGRQWQAEKRLKPRNLDFLRGHPTLRTIDLWGRPIEFESDPHDPMWPWTVWSRGPDERNPSDDIHLRKHRHTRGNR